jgi:hypothetical protein
MKIHALLLILGLIASNLALGATASTSDTAFCSDRKSATYTKEIVGQRNNQISFRNRGGLVNGGVCWWHSRLTRKFAYLAIFRPDLARPSNKDAEKIIKDIRMGKVTEVPGFSNLYDFSRAFSSEVQDRLDKWQKGDGFLRQQWAVGLWGSSETSAEKLKERMDDLYQYVEVEGKLAYQMLQIRGITSHAWLVLNVEKLEDGYKLEVLDSNYTSTNTVYYRNGQEAINSYGGLVPITGKKAELRKLEKTVKKYCKKVN